MTTSLTIALIALLLLPALASSQAQPLKGRANVAGEAYGMNVSYATQVDDNESPISENRSWSHAGLDWTTVTSIGGLAQGTQTGYGGYDDSYALLSGFPPNHEASAIVRQSPTIDKSCSHEVEILLRYTDSAHSARGYEVNLAFDGGYVQIVRWNGALGDFTVLANGSYPAFVDGDTFEASINGNLIKAYVNGNLVTQATDSAIATGNPGLGFFRRECGTNEDLTFTSFTATSHP